MTMLERVAKAVSQKVMEAPFAILEGHQREYVLSIARATIEALMEPTEVMRSRAYVILSEYDASELPSDLNMADAVYRAMLKAVLEEK